MANASSGSYLLDGRLEVGSAAMTMRTALK